MRAKSTRWGLGVLLVAPVLLLGQGRTGQSEKPAPGEESIQRLEQLGLTLAHTAPPRKQGEGPYQSLVLSGGILIAGTGAPRMKLQRLALRRDVRKMVAQERKTDTAASH